MEKIAKNAAELICGAARKVFPKEFVALLRKNKDGIISEVILLPLSIYGKGFGSINFSMLPLTGNTCGSIHSHPTPDNKPSHSDLLLFSKTGEIHLIISYPFRIEDIAAYDSSGRRLDLEIV